jgi:FkbM family methyltransferase
MPAMGLRVIAWDALRLMRHGTLRPSEIWLPEAPSPLSVDPGDRRASRLIARMAIRGEMTVARRLWIDAIAHIRPSLAMDIGVNYGECLFGVTYPVGTTALGVEANPLLLPFIQRSLERHPCRESIRVRHALVGDVDGSVAELRFDPGYSGTASAVASADSAFLDQATVPTVTLDRLVEDAGVCRAGADSIVFKLDVEGFEGHVMRGFTSLARYRRVIGIIEINEDMLRRSGVDGPALVERLLSDHAAYDTSGGPGHLRPVRGWQELLGVVPRGTGGLHTDLLITSRGLQLPDRWRTA